MDENVEHQANNKVGEEENQENPTVEECGICWMPFEATGTSHPTVCSHKYHKNCLKNWVMSTQPTCPVCRRNAKRIVTNGVVTTIRLDMNPQITGRLVRCPCGINSNQDPAHFISCDNCYVRYHMACIPMTNVPDGEWICEGCMTGIEAEFNEEDIESWFHPALYPLFLEQFRVPAPMPNIPIMRNPVANLERYNIGPFNRGRIDPNDSNRHADEEERDLE